MDETLFALQRWYADHCNDVREHHYGIKIQTCDNPGWWVTIDLEETELKGRSFARVAVNVDADGFQQSDRLLCCHLSDDVWNGAGDETKLAIILQIFLTWAGGAG